MKTQPTVPAPPSAPSEAPAVQRQHFRLARVTDMAPLQQRPVRETVLIRAQAAILHRRGEAQQHKRTAPSPQNNVSWQRQRMGTPSTLAVEKNHKAARAVKRPGCGNTRQIRAPDDGTRGQKPPIGDTRTGSEKLTQKTKETAPVHRVPNIDLNTSTHARRPESDDEISGWNRGTDTPNTPSWLSSMSGRSLTATPQSPQFESDDSQ